MTGKDSAALMSRLAELVAGYAGLRPPGWVLEARAADRMRALGSADLRAYVRVLEEPAEGRGGARELAALAEALRVGETRFFRHQAHISAIRRVVVPELAARRADVRRVKAWSAGCATGEEAYTLAILLAGGLPSGFAVEVQATDISREALAVAAAGRYPKQAIAKLPEAERKRWFRAAGAEVEVSPELRAMVRFDARNLLAPVQPRGFDIVLCRNVLIYFDAEVRLRVLDRLMESLEVGGFLFLGYAETLRDQGASLEALRTADGVVYQKAARPAPPPARARSPKVAATRAPRKTAAQPTAENRGRNPENRGPGTGNRRQAMDGPRVLALAGSYEDAEKLSDELAPLLTGGGTLRVELDGAEYLGDAAARVLLRARSVLAHAGAKLELMASRPAIKRFCERHGLYK